jgi:subtilisin family serine protease
MRKRIIVAALLCLVAAHPAAAQNGKYIVVLQRGADVDAVVGEHVAVHDAHVSHLYRHALRGYAASLDEAAAAAIRDDPRVRFVAPSGTLRAGSLCDPTAVQCVASSVDRVDADLSSVAAGDGAGSVPVDVAVLDTGIDVDHPDLDVAGGVSCQESAGIDDHNGHGTSVAGILAAEDNGLGLVGVAPGARLWAVRVLNQGALTGPQGRAEGGVEEVVCGVDWVTSTRTDLDPTNDIEVANLSLGGPGADDGNCGLTNGDPLHLAICNSVAAGVLYVVAAMNERSDLAGFVPAAYDEVLTVTAMWDTDGAPGGLNQGAFPQYALSRSNCDARDDTFVGFSNFAVLPADRARVLAAPGTCILSMLPGGSYGQYHSGTSFAAPVVAGTAAVCIASGACTGSPAAIRQKLLDDAAAFSLLSPGYGFLGDPLHPLDPSSFYFGNHVGFLVSAGLY